MRRFAFIAACCLLAHGAHAASGSALSERYQRSLEALEQNRASEDQTRAERDKLAAQARGLQEQLVANAQKVQQIETAYAATRQDLERLNQILRGLESQLDRDRADVGRLLAVLQRLDADSPPALALRPDDSLAAARGAMQLGTVLPPVYARAASLAKRLKELQETRNSVTAKAAEGQAQEEALKRARVDLDRLLQLRNQETEAAAGKLVELHEITGEMAKAAGNLKSLIDRVAMLRGDGTVSRGMRVVTPGNADAFTLARGSLRLPVIGQMMAGDPAGPGGTRGAGGPVGLWFEAPSGVEAVAPSDSEVVFAGPYQKFGQVLILEIMGGYHLTLAGLGRIDVHVGDQVLAGEPVGALRQDMPARLYLELRRNGQTVDPAPWMSAELRKAKGS
jgi:septal ring factor EnvC (AmiA/AmiB activator)